MYPTSLNVYLLTYSVPLFVFIAFRVDILNIDILYVYINKLADCNRGPREGSLFNSYYTEV